MKSRNFLIWKSTKYFIVLILLSIGCSKDDDKVNQPDDNEPPPVTSTTKTIGSEGGTIALDSIIVTIPVGAFNTNYDLSLAVDSNPVEHPHPTATGIYKFKGFPDWFSKPIKISIKHNGSINGDSYIGHGHDHYLADSDTTFFSYDLIHCKDSAGYLTGNLMLSGQEIYTDGLKAGSEDGPDIIEVWNYFMGITSYRTKKSFHFDSIVYPTTIDPDIIDQLASDLDDIYEIFYNLGIRGDNFPDFKLNEKIEVLDQRPCYLESYYLFYYWDEKKRYSFEIFSDIDYERLRMDIATTFFRKFSFTYFYPCCFHLRSSSFDSSVSFWLEEKLNSSMYPDNFVPSYFSKFKICLNLLLPPSTNCELIKYLTGKYDEEIIVNYYKRVLDGNIWYDALFQSINDPVSEWLPDFFRSFFSRELYPIPESVFADKIFNNSEYTIHIDLPYPNTSDHHTQYYPDFSARVYYIDMNNPAINESSKLGFEITSDLIKSENIEGLLYKIYRNSKVISFIEEGTKFEIDNPLLHKNNNTDLLLVIVNSQTVSMGVDRKDDLSPIHLDVALEEENKLRYNRMRIDLNSIAITRKYNDNRTEIIENQVFYFDFPFDDTYRGNISNNETFTGNWEYMGDPDNGPMYQGEVEATIDPKTLVLLDFDFKIHNKFVDLSGEYEYEYERIRRITGINVQLEPTNYGSHAEIKGQSINNHLNLFDYSWNYTDPVRDNNWGWYIEDIDISENSALIISFFNDN